MMAQAGMGMSLSESVFDRLLRERIIFLGGPVDDDSANRIGGQLLLLAAEDPGRDINLYINSPGGSVSAGMAIYDIMQWVSCDVATFAIGLAASMGQFLLCAGTSDKRFALRYSEIMMHQPSGGFGGTAADIAVQAEHMLHVKKTMTERIAYHCGQSYEQIAEDADRDRWFTAEEARQYGIVDHIISRSEQAGGTASPGVVS